MLSIFPLLAILTTALFVFLSSPLALASEKDSNYIKDERFLFLQNLPKDRLKVWLDSYDLYKKDKKVWQSVSFTINSANLHKSKTSEVHLNQLEWRGDLPNAKIYIIDTDKPFTGISHSFHPNGTKNSQITWKDGKHVEGSEKWWNIKGELVNSYLDTLLPFNPADGVTWGETQDREGLRYLKNSDTPYTGKLFNVYKNGLKSSELNYKDGKLHGPWITWYGRWKSSEFNHKDNKAHGTYTKWHRNGKKQSQVIYKDDEKISAQHWNSKGESVDSIEEALDPENEK